MNLIDKEALIFSLVFSDETGNIPCGQMKTVLKIVKAQSLVQPEQQKGKWITSDDMYETGVCSVCKCDSQEPVSYAITMFKYCPNCGAKMEENE